MVIIAGLMPNRPVPTPQAVHVMVYLGRYPAGRVNTVLLVAAQAMHPRTDTVPATERAKEAESLVSPTLVMPRIHGVHLGSPVGVALSSLRQCQR